MLYHSIEVVEGPEEEVVSVEEFKAYLRLNTSDEDDLLPDCIQAAREQFEHYTDGRIVLATTFAQHFPSWERLLLHTPNRYASPNLYTLQLCRGQTTAVESVTYFDPEDEEVELEDYDTDLTGVLGLVYYRPTGMLPYLSYVKPRPITVEYTAGWPTVDAVPADVKRAILYLAAHFFEMRTPVITGTIVSEVPMTFKSLCSKYQTGQGV